MAASSLRKPGHGLDSRHERWHPGPIVKQQYNRRASPDKGAAEVAGTIAKSKTERF
jgi:hypothetical protein